MNYSEETLLNEIIGTIKDIEDRTKNRPSHMRGISVHKDYMSDYIKEGLEEIGCSVEEVTTIGKEEYFRVKWERINKIEERNISQ